MQNFSENLRADLLGMLDIISISQVTPSRLHTQNLIFSQVSEHTCMLRQV